MTYPGRSMVQTARWWFNLAFANCSFRYWAILDHFKLSLVVDLSLKILVKELGERERDLSVTCLVPAPLFSSSTAMALVNDGCWCWVCVSLVMWTLSLLLLLFVVLCGLANTEDLAWKQFNENSSNTEKFYNLIKYFLGAMLPLLLRHFSCTIFLPWNF